MPSVQPPSGFRDFINQDASRRLHLIHRIAKVYESFGFLPLETSALESLDVLLGGGGGEENEKLIFKVLKRGEKLQTALASGPESIESKIAEFGLRFDMTVPLSRAVAAYRNQIHFPWKVFHVGSVWRAERPQKGRFREFTQCDVDIVGCKDIGAEIEVIQAAVMALRSVGATGFELRVNDRRWIQAVGEKFGFVGPKFERFAILLDKKDKMELAEIIAKMAEILGQDLPADLVACLEGRVTLESARPYHEEAIQGLQTLISTLESLSLPLTQIVFDPSLVRGMGYYTGPVFELRHPSAGYSFGGGGRYDRLIGRFSGTEIPACGFSIGFERLALLLAESEAQKQKDLSKLFVPVFTESLRASVLGWTAPLRSAGLTIDVFPAAAKLKNQFKFAADAGYRWVLIVGEQEWSSKIFKLKDFKEGSELELPEHQMIDHLRKSMLNAVEGTGENDAK